MRWLGLLAALFGSAPVMGAAPAPVKVWIASEPAAGGGEVFVGYASAESPLTLRYELVGEKRGSSGRSSVSQGGRVAVAPGTAARLSQVSFGRLGESDHYSIHLRVYDGVELRGETVLDK